MVVWIDAKPIGNQNGVLRSFRLVRPSWEMSFDYTLDLNSSLFF